MIINLSNVRMIDSIYIHDDMLESLEFSHFKKRLQLSVLKGDPQDTRRLSVEFFDVIGFEVSSCDFWGASPHILDFECVVKDDYSLTSKLFDILLSYIISYVWIRYEGKIWGHHFNDK